MAGPQGGGASLEEKTVRSTTVFSGRVLTLRVDRVQLPGGREAERELVIHPGASAVVAVDGAGEVLLVEQYRYPAGTVLLEIPAGKLDGHETPVECARRELLEETGTSAASWTPLGAVFTTPGFSNEVIHLFLATGLEHCPGAQPDADEVLRVRRVPVEDAVGMIRRGEIRDAKTIVGLLRALEGLAAGESAMRDGGARR
ncbi:MAG: NUDIX hydrolase [Ignavibacteriales bacterium]